MKTARILTCIYIALFLAGAGEVRAQGLKPSVAGYVRRAESYVSSNAWNAAKREIDEGLGIIPDDSDLRYLNGYYYYVIGDMDEARYNLVRSVQDNDDQVKAKRLLVDVEDNLGHYSSAICYINELLDIQPYDRDLWRRKIAFYRKMGNDVEADAALERLFHIFPNDSLVVADVRRRDIETRDNILRNSSLAEASNNLERWIDRDPNSHDYYLELISTYEKMGDYDRALGAANRGLVQFPNDAEIINKAAGILTERGLYSQAYAFIKDKQYGSRVYNNLLSEMANDARMHDPYEANGRLWLATRDRDALNYLINTALTRGYFDDARSYINEAMRQDGRTPALLMKLYTVEKQSGNEKAGMRLLNELFEKTPEDEDLVESYTEMMLRLCDQDFAGQQWEDACRHLDRVLELMPETSESWPSTVSRQIMVLGRLDRRDEACELYERAAQRSPENRRRFASAYEDLAAARLKDLVETERYEDAYREAAALLEAVPDSEPALRCLINMSQTLGRDEAFCRYAEMGYAAHPDVPYFTVKQAVALQEQGRYADALALLRPDANRDEYVYPQLAAAYSGISQDWAAKLLKNNMPDLAMQVADTALAYDPKNRGLLYTKGLAYEKLKDYAQAYEYQHRYYEPGNAELEEFTQHMRYLGYRSFRNRIEASYTHAFFDSHDEATSSIGHLYSIASFSYTRIGDRNSFTGQLNYKGIDGYHEGDENEPGGTGLEAMLQWEHAFSARWSMTVSASASTRYFNKYGANLSFAYSSANGWTAALRLGYRRTPKTYLYLGGINAGKSTNAEYNLFLASPSVEKAWEHISLRASTDLVAMAGSLYYNVGLRGSFFFKDDNTSSISLLAGFGSFPELSFFEQTALRNLSHTNTMVGVDARILISRRFALGLTGSWNTCYDPVSKPDGTILDSYRNIYALAARVQIAF
jgi:tetratricopeptide (TPR) repeat protein